MPVTASIIASAAAPIVGGVVGNIAAQDDERRAKQAREAALAQILGVSVPELQEANLAQYAEPDSLSALREEEILLGPSRMEQINIDPRLKNAQMNALASLEDIAARGGMTAQEEAQLNQIRREVARDDRARREAILQNMQMRGMGGSGAELAAQLASSQASAELQSQEGDRQAAMAQARALQALQQAGQLGTQFRTQEFGEQSDVARAADEIARFNAANRQAVQTRNVQRASDIDRFNLQNRQNVAQDNVDTQNKQQLTNINLIQRDFANRQGQATNVAGARRQEADDFQREADRTRQMWSTIGQGVGQGAGAVGQYAAKP